MIISIISQKGGVGKTTVSINLALALAGLPGKPSVALVDTDEQQSAINTLKGHARDNLKVIQAISKPHQTIKKLKEQFVVIDTPPRTGDLMVQSAGYSDLVIIPVQPSPLDVRAIGMTVQALQKIQEHWKREFDKDFACRFLINRVSAGTTLAGEIKKILNGLYPGFPILETMLHNREAYKKSLIDGQSVIEYDKRSLAAKEIGELLVEIEKVVKG